MKCAFLSGSTENMEMDERSLFRKVSPITSLNVCLCYEWVCAEITQHPDIDFKALLYDEWKH